uniref:HTH CENPB-type domain-containing protein n=1 Tax=Plectus sambesii TaxID=2011161 RepID=A0A914VUI6_9BILA
MSTLLTIEGFKASEGWLTNFKHHHSITFRSNQGEAGAIDMESLGKWQQQVLREELVKFSPDDIFNMDEAGLFLQLLPNTTLAFKGERCTNGKKSKERITVLVGANMSGTEKLPLLVIEKSAKPRCFKNAHVPLNYTANKKAWMTGDVFESWLKNWDKKLKKDGRKVLLYIDNCSSHPLHIVLQNITMKFFPPNTTAMSQVGGALSLAEIVEVCSTVDVNRANKLDDSKVMDISDEEAKIEEPAITSLQAQNAMKLVRQNVEKNFANPIFLRYSDELDNATFLEGYKN